MRPFRTTAQRVAAAGAGPRLPEESQPSHSEPAYTDASVSGFQSHNGYCLPIPGPGIESSTGRTHFEDLDAVSTLLYTNTQRQTSVDATCDPYPIPLYSAKKFPALECPEFSFMYGQNVVPAPSITSSHSSTMSQGSSARSTLSSIVTDLPQQQQLQQLEHLAHQHQYHQKQPPQRSADYLSGPSSWSRGPSPLDNAVSAGPSPTEASESTARPSRESGYFATEDSGRRHEADLNRGHASHCHVCLWGASGPCEKGPFATKEELNWHVKAEHLLVCPVLGCSEDAFADKDLVDVHVRWAHKHGSPESGLEPCQSSNLLSASTVQQSLPSEKPCAATAASHGRPPVEDMRFKRELTIATSKKRCRDQLRSVVEKKAKRNTGKNTSDTLRDTFYAR
jgi:hypothetical protein